MYSDIGVSSFAFSFSSDLIFIFQVFRWLRLKRVGYLYTSAGGVAP